ncbi:polysaccharide deacetylase [Virgibacillus indicus]|uniref:Polysaccharide deacetylase n=1 Tax=Virgibacillus indicus TaxID=2024554 RepID=A0A265NGS6_9BACI|nr:polysaccharide deacetylase family protein [Virgibacillus indicus]OZU90456.1 polysaccharide deacetylase [Virgibacillus indicus]
MKRIVIGLFISIIVLSACNAEETSSNEQVEKETAEEPSEKEIKENPDKEVTDEEKETAEETEEPLEEINPKYKVSENWSIIPMEDGVNEKVVLLTIDDAPDNYAVDMAETLKELEVNAIFFVNGHFLDTPEEVEKLRKIHDMGFIIGNHTYNHPLLSDLSEEEQKEEIVQLNDRVEEIIGERPTFFRAPHGVNTDFSKQVAEAEGMTLMNWSYGYDYFEPYKNKEKLITAMVTGEGPEVDVPYSLLKPGANLLMHDREWTAAALEEIVNGLRDKGYEMVDPKLIQTK